MKRLCRDKLVVNSQSSIRKSVRSVARQSWPRGAGALLATAMLLLAFAPFQSANADSLKQLNAQWAHISSSLVSGLAATDDVQNRAQGEQLWRWMQTRVASLDNSQSLSPRQVASLLDEWQQSQMGSSQRGKIGVAKVTFQSTSTQKQRQLSTRLCATTFLAPLSSPQTITPTFDSQRLAFTFSSHAAAKLSGVRTNRRHE